MTNWNFTSKNTTNWNFTDKSIVSTGKILLESAFSMLRESGDALLRENAGTSSTEWTFQTKN